MEQGELDGGLLRGQGGGGGGEPGQEGLPGQAGEAGEHPARAGEEVLGPIEHHPQPLEPLEGEGARPAGGQDAPGGGHPHPGDPQQQLVVRPAHLHREELQVAEGPAALGVQPGVQIGVVLVQELVGAEVIVPQQPVRLIEPVLPEQGRPEALGGGEERAGGHGHIGGVEHPLEPVAAVEPLAEPEDVEVALRGGPHDHLGGLARRGEAGGVAEEAQLLPGAEDAVPDLPHGGEDGGLALVRGQPLQRRLGGQLDVHAQPVAQQAQPVGEQGVRPRDGLGVDIPREAPLPQQPQLGDHPLGGVVRVPEDGGGEEEALDVVAPVEAGGELTELPGGEGGPGHVVGAAVDAVGAVVGAGVGHEHLEQGDAPAVGGEGVAAPRRHGGAQASRPGPAVQAAGGTGGVVLGRVGEDGQLLHQVHGVHPQYRTFVLS